MRYTARKILTLLVTMLVVSLLTFAAFDMISGDPAATLLGTQPRRKRWRPSGRKWD